MVSYPSLYPLRLFSSLLFLSGFLFASLLGCALETNTKESESDEPPYVLEASLTDSSTAMVVESRYGRDTVRAAVYQNQLAARRQGKSRKGKERNSSNVGLHEAVVRGYALRHAMVGEAQERGTEIDSSQLARRVRERQQGYEDQTAYQQATVERGSLIDSVRRREANTLRIRQLRATFAENADPPTDSEIRAFLRKQQQEEVRLRYILFQTDSDSSDDAFLSAKNKAQVVLDSVKAGVSFSALARRHSDSPMAEIGCMMPRYQPVSQFSEPMAETIRTLQDSGEVAQSPVHTPRGIHLVQLIDRRTSSPPKREAQWKLIRKRRGKAIRDAQRSLLEAVKVKVNPEVVRTDFKTR